MKTVIKFKLVKFEKALAFQILEQNDELIKRGKFKFESKLKIISGATPEIVLNRICIRGSVIKEDFNVSVYTFTSNAERDKYFNDAIYTLKEMADSLKNKKVIEKDIYEF